MKTITTTLALALCSTLLLTGCVAAIGNKGSKPDGTTLGRELMDLKEAKEQGVISDAEYAVQRDRLLQNR